MTRRVWTITLTVLLLPSSSAGQAAPGDRYLCYEAALAKGEAKFTAVEKTIQDQLGTFVAT